MECLPQHLNALQLMANQCIRRRDSQSLDCISGRLKVPPDFIEHRIEGIRLKDSLSYELQSNIGRGVAQTPSPQDPADDVVPPAHTQVFFNILKVVHDLPGNDHFR